MQQSQARHMFKRVAHLKNRCNVIDEYIEGYICGYVESAEHDGFSVIVIDMKRSQVFNEAYVVGLYDAGGTHEQECKPNES